MPRLIPRCPSEVASDAESEVSHADFCRGPFLANSELDVCEDANPSSRDSDFLAQ